ncbi:MAG: hypothetical protein ACPG5B_14435 [Chitinophagales bacterium]
MKQLEEKLNIVLKKYAKNFSKKTYTDKYKETDILMKAFGITQILKRENKQYWGRELGKCWENLLRDLFEATSKEFELPRKIKGGEPADFFVGKDAIDTKYRVGSGDSGTLKKFEQYGKLLQKEGYQPILLFLRNDNLRAAISKMEAGGWIILTGDDTFKYIKEKTNFDLKTWLINLEKLETFKIKRP